MQETIAQMRGSSLSCFTLPAAALITIAGAAAPGAQGISAGAQPAVYSERFDTVHPPSLPGGWRTSAERSAAGDFTTTETGAVSPPVCVVSSNATVAQSLTAPPLDLNGWRGCAVLWMERRSASYDASLHVEVSTDGGNVFLPVTGKPLTHPGGTDWHERAVALPEWTDGLASVLLRWRTSGDGTGTAGTIRFDDVLITGTPRWDVSIAAESISPGRAVAGEEVRCIARVTNAGFGAATGVRVDWSADIDGDGRPDGPGSGTSIVIGSLLPGDSAASEHTAILPSRGPLLLFAVVAADSDMAAADDTAAFYLSPSAPPHSVIINEIMYDPLPGKPEYVELSNRSPDSITLAGWRLIDDEDDSTGGEFGSGAAALAPGGYLICSPDSGIRSEYPGIPPEAGIVENVRGLSLNNTGDLLLLVDDTGWPVDRVGYAPEWHTPALDVTQGRSLERIASAGGETPGWNWGTSAGASGGTPGTKNSLAAEPASPAEALSFSPNPFSPDGDGFEDVTVIGFRLGGVSVVARVRIYDREGRLVRTLTGSSYVAGTGSFVWNGYDDRGRKVGVGIYVVLVDAVDGSGTEAYSAKGAVVVAGRL